MAKYIDADKFKEILNSNHVVHKMKGEDNVLELAESIRKLRKSTRNFRIRTERRAGRRNRRLEKEK